MSLKWIQYSILVVLLLLAIAFGCVRVFSYEPMKEIIHWFPIFGVTSVLAGIVLRISKRQNNLIIYGFIFVLLLSTSHVIATRVIEYQYKKVFQEGTKIAIALDKYNSEHNEYPNNLHELVPNYINSLKKIKVPWERNTVEFNYFIKENGQHYYLNFESYYYDGKGWVEEP